MKTLNTLVAAAALLGSMGASRAELIDLGDGTVRDTLSNLIWLQNWTVNGQKNWETQKAWAETALDGFAGSTDWRLPDINEARNLVDTYDLNYFGNRTPFYILGGPIWSSTEYVDSRAGAFAWFFYATGGSDLARQSSNAFWAVAVRNADVSAVPEPKTYAMLILGISALVAMARRRQR
jgi:hypothetical protein